ncbi:MAG TPA: DNA primase [Pyrinomonadaceae bacterium]|nr:DNA primase [Pyrinomonadaceae bacterium]
MRFPQSFIDDLRRQADIVRVISDYVPLKKKGANWMACCPFHQEKTPSFSVNPAKDIYYCFGCGKGGSVISFVMEMERLPFPEAVRVVAEKAGVALPAMEQEERYAARKSEAEAVVKLNALALAWWERQLQENSREAEAAREYLRGRGITEETRALFRLGYAPDRWDGLSAHLEKEGASAAEIEKSGLVVKKERGGYYDRFRGRVIFPVLDAVGKPVAFGGRTLAHDGEPKYLNSPETAAYTKGRHLFGLHLTRDEIKRKHFAILVEGYLDLIVPYQHGVGNMVASLGTALTGEQAKLLGRFARKVVVNYDGDKAGIAAAKRATEALLAEDYEVKVLVLPDGADPDEFIRQHGAEEYQERRGKAVPHIQFVLDQAARNRNLLRPAEKAEAVEEVLPFLRAVRNSIQKREYFDMAMDSLRIEEPALRTELWRTIKAPAVEGGAIKRHVARFAGHAQMTVAEQQLLELIVHDDDLRKEVLAQIEPADYEDLASAAVYAALVNISQSETPFSFDALRERTADDVVAEDLISLLSLGEAPRAEGEALDDYRLKAESCLTALRLMSVDRRLRELTTAMAAAERAGEAEESARLSMQYVTLSRQRSQLLPQSDAGTAAGG